MMGKLNDLEHAGQAVWLDFLDRQFLAGGGFGKLVEEDGVTGVTSNPSIFEKAIGHGSDYDEGLAAFDRANPDASAIHRYEAMAIEDLRMACDILRPAYDRLGGKDGYASLEVSPYLADDTDGTIAQATDYWRRVDRPNLMIKIPGTRAGAPAIAASIAEGININVTLLFGLGAYQMVAEAHASGLEERVRRGLPIGKVAGIASFFVSRIDTAIDQEIDRRVEAGDPEAEALKTLRGKVAIANAKAGYQWYLEYIASDRWQALAAKGAMPQRLLWASTGTKDPAYPDTLYIDSLIGPDTVSTMPVKTMDAFRDHGVVEPTLTRDVDDARRILAEVKRLGLDLDEVTDRLVTEGVAAFAKSFDTLIAAIAQKHPATA
jgi:transaldolase/glucose-6-phosphate isomerase